jgi:hypothetical protein
MKKEKLKYKHIKLLFLQYNIIIRKTSQKFCVSKYSVSRVFKQKIKDSKKFVHQIINR